MSVVVSDLKARFGIDDKNFQTGMKRVDKQLGNTKMDIFSLEKAWKLAWAGMGVAVVSAVTKIGKESISLASDMRELDNVLLKTFGTSMNKIKANVDAFSVSAGRSVLAMRHMTSEAGAILKGFGFIGDELSDMSLSLNKTAVDMGSFFNVLDSEAFTALKAGVVGETEPLRRFGIVLTEASLQAFALEKNIKKAVRQMSEAEKVQLRYNFIMEKTAFFSGDAADTIGSTANQTKLFSENLKNLKTNIGFLLEPRYNKALKTLNEGLTSLVKLTKELAKEEISLGITGDLSNLEQYINSVQQGVNIGSDNKEIIGEQIIVALSKQSPEILEKIGMGKSPESFMDTYNKIFEESGMEKATEYAFNVGKRALKANEIYLEALKKQEEAEALKAKTIKDTAEANKLAYANNDAEWQAMLDEEEAIRKKEELLKKEKFLLGEDKKIADADKEIQDFINQERLNNLNVAREIYNQFAGLTYDEAMQKYNELTSGMEASSIGLDEFTMALEDYLNSLDESTEKTEELPSNLESLSKGMSEVAQITSELSELFGDDFLGALTNTLNSASSLAMNISQGNYFGAVASGISLANDIKDYLSADSDIEDKRKKANDKFEEAVNKFEKTIDDMNIGEAIKYAQLTPPSQLASAGVTGAKGPVDFEWYDALLGAVMPKAWYKILGGGKPESAKLDTSAIQEQLNKAGYGDIDVASIFGNYAQYSEYRDWSDWGKKKSYISGYDIAGATEEINQIIEDMYQKNLTNFKTAVGLTADNFKNVMIKTFTSGGEISENLNEMMRDAAIKGFFSQEAFTKLNEMLGDKFSEALFKDLNMEDFKITSDMSLEDAMSTYSDTYEMTAERLTELFDKLGISVDNTTESMNRLSSSSTNLPSGVKTALASYQATNVTNGNTNIIFNGDTFGDNIQKKIIQGINAAKGTATGNYMPLY